MQDDLTMKQMDIYNANMPSKQDGHETHRYDISYFFYDQMLI